LPKLVRVFWLEEMLGYAIVIARSSTKLALSAAEWVATAVNGIARAT